MKRAICVLAPCAFGVVAPADILGISGDLVLIPPPASVLAGELESDDVAHIFVEQEELETTVEFYVDISEPGLVAPTGIDVFPPGSLSVSDVPPGTLVESVYIHTDAVTPGTAFAGRVDFDREVIGLIVRTQSLNDTDPLVGSPTTAYGDSRAIGGGDSVRITSDRTSVIFAFGTGEGTDQLRILVSADPPCNAADLAPIFGRLDLADITTFVSLFLSGDPEGDLNGDGLFDLSDVLAFTAAFVAGCPSGCP